MAIKLSAIEITEQLKRIEGWEVRGRKLRKIFRFSDFAEAFGFIAASAIIAESMNHHPEWSNVYNVVDIELTTHDVGGISDLDFNLAKRIDTLHSAKSFRQQGEPN